MSKKKDNARRAAYEAKQEKEGKKVVKWIIGVLMVLALFFAVYTCVLMG